MTDTPLFDGIPGVSAPDVDLSIPDAHECDCEAKLADLTRAVEIQSERLGEQSEKIGQLITAVNTVGQMVQSIMENANGFLGQFKGMNPLEVLRGVMSGGNKR